MEDSFKRHESVLIELGSQQRTYQSKLNSTNVFCKHFLKMISRVTTQNCCLDTWCLSETIFIYEFLKGVFEATLKGFSNYPFIYALWGEIIRNFFKKKIFFKKIIVGHGGAHFSSTALKAEAGGSL